MTSTTSRRALLQSAAWTAPALAVASAAPAFASSPTAAPSRPGAIDCALAYSVDFAPFLANTAAPGTGPTRSSESERQWHNEWLLHTEPSPASTPAGYAGPTSELLFTTTMTRVDPSSSTSAHTGTLAPSGHFTFVDLKQHQLSDNDSNLVVREALKFALASSSTAWPEMQISLRFNPPVRNLSFTLTDIDSNTNNQRDRVVLDEVRGPQGVVAWTATETSAPQNSTARSKTYRAGTALSTAAFNASGLTADEKSRAWVGNTVSNDLNVANADNTHTDGNLRIVTSGDLVEVVSLRFANIYPNNGFRENSINIGAIHYEIDGVICAPA